MTAAPTRSNSPMMPNAVVIEGAAHGSADLHAVRWATRTKGRKPFDEPRWTKWHASADSCRTLCGLVIVIATEASFTPVTDDEMSRVDCPRCARKLNPPNSALSESGSDKL